MKFDDIFTYSNLSKAAQKCYKGVGWKGSVQNYRNNEILYIHEMLQKLSKPTYKSMPFYEFTIHERGKIRRIKSLHISERVMQKCLCDEYLNPLIESQLIYDNGACRKGKGVSFARSRFVEHLRAYWLTHGTEGYVLTYDFSKYFDSINHEILLDQLRPLVKDDKVFRLIRTLIKDFGDKGLGLGSEISQMLALYYPDKIDRHIKENKRIKYYGRYMDDGYLLHPDKDYLIKVKSDIIKIAKELDIKINEKKTQIHKIQKGIIWLKTRYILTDTGRVIKKPYKNNIVRMRRKLKKLHKKGIPQESIDNSYQSWLGSIKQTHSYRVVKRMNKLKGELDNEYKERANK